MSLVVPTLGTTNDGGVTSPAEAKIIVGGPCTRRGNIYQLTLMRVLTLVCPRAAVGRSETGWFLEGSF